MQGDQKALRAGKLEAVRGRLITLLPPDEELIWFDQPPGWREAMWPLLSVVFMSCWTTLAGVATLSALVRSVQPDAPEVLHVVAIFGGGLCAFGAVVLCWLVWRVLTAWFTFYGLTGCRLLVVRSLWPGQVLSVGPGWLQKLEILGPHDKACLFLRGRQTRRGMPAKITLYDVAEPWLVAEAIRGSLSPV